MNERNAAIAHAMQKNQRSILITDAASVYGSDFGFGLGSAAYTPAVVDFRDILSSKPLD